MTLFERVECLLRVNCLDLISKQGLKEHHHDEQCTPKITNLNLLPLFITCKTDL